MGMCLGIVRMCFSFYSNAERNCSLFHHLLSVCFTTCFLSVWQFDVEAIPCNASRKAVCVSLHMTEDLGLAEDLGRSVSYTHLTLPTIYSV